MPAHSLPARQSLTRVNLLASVAAAVLLSACSTDFERFANNPSDADPVYTASVPKVKAAASTASAEDDIASKPLAGASQAPTYNYGSTAKAPVYKQQNTVTSAPQVAETEAPTAPEGGTVTVGSGMTLYSIARANNVSVSQLAAANNIKPPYAVRQGQVLRMPGATQAAATPEETVIEDEAPAAPKLATAAPKATKGEMHEVASGDTLFSLGRRYGVPPYAIADANGLSKSSTLSIGQKLKIPGASGAMASAPKAAAPPEAAEEPVAETKIAKDESKVEPIPVPDAEEAAAPEQKVAELPAPAATEDASAGMRWPVRGKVISGFGSKPNGLKNEGINIAVPEGTSIRAAEGGVVAYSGNELKGYGNLILIRHEGGFVTAYAHAKELFVKRGDTVKRGDVIAKAGQTGSVSSPQLHFEVRKGATALDPMKFLSSATASN